MFIPFYLMNIHAYSVLLIIAVSNHKSGLRREQWLFRTSITVSSVFIVRNFNGMACADSLL